jgi:hypothetical protein
MACRVLDRAIQAFGAEGVSQDQWLAKAYAGLRTLRIADVGRAFRSSRSFVLTLTFQGPDEVSIDIANAFTLTPVN